MKLKNKEKNRKNEDDYSWWKVHFKSIKGEFLILISGIISNFRKVTWHKKGLAYEYLAMICIIVFLAVFFYLIYLLVDILQ